MGLGATGHTKVKVKQTDELEQMIVHVFGIGERSESTTQWLNLMIKKWNRYTFMHHCWQPGCNVGGPTLTLSLPLRLAAG